MATSVNLTSASTSTKKLVLFTASSTDAPGRHQHQAIPVDPYPYFAISSVVGIMDRNPIFSPMIGQSGAVKGPISREDELDRILDAMSEDERIKLIMSLAGSRSDLEMDTDDDWGFIDWDAPDDVSV